MDDDKEVTMDDQKVIDDAHETIEVDHNVVENALKAIYCPVCY